MTEMPGASGPQGSAPANGRVRITPVFRPHQVEKLPPCQGNCPVSGNVRTWIGIVAQRGKTETSRRDAYVRAWGVIAARNPFVSSLGRVCPHPCESDCNRSGLDEPVAVSAMERFLGDWALAEELPLARLDDGAQPESIGVVGAGPSGLSFAYQMARRGYRVTVYEGRERAGGMLRYGIPDYRLPPGILDAEIDRILRLGVELRVETAVGRDISLAELRERHAVLYLAIGAQASRSLSISGEGDPAVWNGVEYLAAVNRGMSVDVGRAVVVVGGGNTAMDAARTARRAGAEVTILYRRSRDEMPAIEAEVEEALAEGVQLLLLAAPERIERRDPGSLVLTAVRMQLGEPDGTGRRRPVVLPDSELELPVDTVIVAVSQEPAWAGLEELQADGLLAIDDRGAVTPSLWGGGDVVESGVAVAAVAHGLRAAETLHARLRGLGEPPLDGRRPIGPDALRLDSYDPKARVRAPHLSPDEALRRPDAEVGLGIGEAEFLEEASRCLSCGSCLGCEQCWMYCTVQCFTRLDDVRPGAFFSQSLDLCEECGKCIEVCPTGFLEIVGETGQAPTARA